VHAGRIGVLKALCKSHSPQRGHDQRTPNIETTLWRAWHRACQQSPSTPLPPLRSLSSSGPRPSDPPGWLRPPLPDCQPHGSPDTAGGRTAAGLPHPCDLWRRDLAKDPGLPQGVTGKVRLGTVACGPGSLLDHPDQAEGRAAVQDARNGVGGELGPPPSLQPAPCGPQLIAAAPDGSGKGANHARQQPSSSSAHATRKTSDGRHVPPLKSSCKRSMEREGWQGAGTGCEHEWHCPAKNGSPYGPPLAACPDLGRLPRGWRERLLDIPPFLPCSARFGQFHSDPNGASWVSSGSCQACAGLLPRDPQERIRLRTSLARARLVAVRSSPYAVPGNGPQNKRNYTCPCARGPLRPQAVQGCQCLARPL
jgi:hypothetical protein